ncbi:MAG: hypothetical protein NUV67_04920 [archaeon]|nr:hypothetical protein [archaeon]
MKAKLTLLFLALFATAAFAAHSVTVIQPNDSNRLAGTVGISFNITDGNFVAATHDVNLSIAISATAGVFTTYLVQDVNANTYCGGAANYADVNCTYAFDTTAQSDGNYFIDVNAITFRTAGPVDQNSVIDSSDVNVQIDNSASALTVISPANNSVLPVNVFSVTISYSSSEADIAAYYVWLDSGAEINNGTATTYTFSGFSAGGHTVYVKAQDNLDNNSATASTSFTAVSSGGGPFCGDNSCGGNETSVSCPSDCGAVCGDGACTNTESKQTCPADCGPNRVCGDGACTPGENYNNCAADCEAPQGQIVRETVLSRETKGKPTAEQIAAILTAAGASQNAIEKASAAVGKTNVSRNFEVVKQKNGENETYSSNVEIVVENTSGKKMNNVKVVEQIPKIAAQTSGEVKTNGSVRVLNQDPVIEFTIDSIEAGESKSIKYTIDAQFTDATISEYEPAIVASFEEDQVACTEAACDDANPCTADSCGDSGCLNIPANNGTSCGIGKVCSSGACISSQPQEITEKEDSNLLLGIGILAIVVVVAYLIYTRK